MGASIATPRARSESSPLCTRVACGACPLPRDAAPKIGKGIGISPGRHAKCCAPQLPRQFGAGEYLAFFHRAILWRGGGPVHLAGGSVHRLLGAHLAEESAVEVPLDDVGLPGIIRQLRPYHEVLELLAIDREVLHVLLDLWVAVERG